MQHQPATDAPAASCETAAKRPLSSLTDAEAERVLLEKTAAARQLATARSLSGSHLRPAVTLPRRFPTQEEVDEIVKRREQEQAAREAAERVRLCRARYPLPRRYADAQLDQLEQLPADASAQYQATVAKLRKMLERPLIVAMIGPCGVGKTHMACGLCNAFNSAGRSARYIKALDYVQEVRRTWGVAGGGRELAKLESETIRLGLLVLDEWQLRGETEDENKQLLRLIDKRYDEERPTLIVSNHATRAEFADSVDARIISRMRDAGGVVVCDWKEIRGRVRDAASIPPCNA